MGYTKVYAYLRRLGSDVDLGTEENPLLVQNTGGANSSVAKVTDHSALQVTPPAEGKSTFGETLTAQSTPSIELLFHNSINPLISISRANQSGTISQSDSMLNVSTGAATNSSAELLSKQLVRYHPGQGIRARFTGLFTTGVANSSQGVGIGNTGNGYFFGYDGDAFGILHRKGGTPEIRTLTITTGSTTDEDVTITLNSDADATVAVTDTGDTTLTANEIVAHDYSDVGRGWTAYAVGATVIFISWDSSSRTGTYSLSSATSAVGTFAQTLAGVAPTDSWIPQASWNGDDNFDGEGVTGVTIDPTKGNVFQVVYQYLGFGGIQFFVQDPDDKEFHLVHTISYANSNTVPSLSEPSLPLCAFAENTSNTSDIVVKSGSMAGFVDGKDGLLGQRRGVEASVTLGATAVETPFLTLRNTEVFNSKINSGQFKLLIIGASADHTKPVEVKFYTNATLTGASFSDLESGVSIVQKDTSATAFSGGTFLFSIPLGKAGNNIINLSSDKFAGLVSPGDSLTTTIAPKSGNAAEATVSYHLVELF